MSGKISDIKVSELLLKLIEIEDPEKREFLTTYDDVRTMKKVYRPNGL